MNNIPPNVTPELDPRWEWYETRRLCDVGPSYVRGACNHLEVVPVETAIPNPGGPGFAPTVEVVAHLCLTCDQQLPAEWQATT